jgi:peptide/nickel transport system ATP-binding protein
MTQPLLQVERLVISCPSRTGEAGTILRSVSFEVEGGRTLGLVGESGCGKTTICRAVLGHLPPGGRILGGSIRFGGFDMSGLGRKALEAFRGKRIGLIPQNVGLSLNPTMRVGRHIAEALMVHLGLPGPEAKRRAIEALGRMLLPQPEVLAGRYPHELSGGQQQRVAIALALAPQPELLILDEPTTGVDATTKVKVLDLLRGLQSEQSLAMLYVSHNLDEIARISDTVAVMYAGEIVEVAPVVELFTRPTHPYTRALLESMPRLAAADMPRAILGRPPALGEVLKGCSFAPRCRFADDICTAISPLLEPCLQESHLVRCHRWRYVQESDFSQVLPQAVHQVIHKVTEEPVLELEEVAVTYARPKLLDRVREVSEPPAAVSGITLKVRSGETLALVGESGSGKTTIVRALAGLRRVQEGRLKFRDFDLRMDVDERPRELCRQIQIIFQNPDASLNPRQSIARIIERPLHLYFSLSRKERRERMETLLRRVRLGPEYLLRYPSQLSGGERQRVAIARAFAAEPSVVLCDEVTSALDVSVQAAILELLAELQAEGGVTYIFITHDLALVRALADQVAVLYRGRLCEMGPVDQVFSPPWHPYTHELLRAVLELSKAPELGKERPLALIKGETLEITPISRGCPFQRRCALRIGSICDTELPPWQLSGDGHRIRCHIPFHDLRNSQTALHGDPSTS